VEGSMLIHTEANRPPKAPARVVELKKNE